MYFPAQLAALSLAKNPYGKNARIVPTGTLAEVAAVKQLESQLALLPQIELVTDHVIHAGMYARSIRIPAGAAITGALIKRATLLIVSGDVTVSGGAEPFRMTGYNIVPASAGRKTAWYAHTDTDLTMIFPTSARTVEDAEREFTDEALLSQRNPNNVLITED
jgi:hypothetical protein